MEANEQLITVRVLKYDGSEHRTWHGRLSHRDNSLLMLDAEFAVDVSHQLLGHIKRGTRLIEYYWLDRSYNVFQFLDDDGRTRLWYCNIGTIPQLTENELVYVDLDIDVLVQPDGSYQILDLDEFNVNVETFNYPEDVKTEVFRSLDELIRRIDAREFPFQPQPAAVFSVIKS